MPAPNPYEGWDEDSDALYQEQMQEMCDDIVFRYPALQADVEGIVIDPSTDDIAKYIELESLVGEVDDRLAEMRNEIGPIVISPWQASLPTKFDKLKRVQVAQQKPNDQNEEHQRNFSSYEKKLDNFQPKLFSVLGKLAIRSPFGWIMRPKN